MGDSRPAHKVGTFLSRANDLPSGGILPVVYLRDRPATWSASIHKDEYRPEIYGTLLEEFPKGHGDAVDEEHRLPPTDIWSVREDHTDFRGHPASMRHGT